MINLGQTIQSRVQTTAVLTDIHEQDVCAVSPGIIPLNPGGLAVPLEHAVVRTHWLTPPTFCHVQVAIPDEPDVVEEAVVEELVVLEPVVLVLVLVLVVLVLEVLEVLLLVLVVVGTLNSRLSIDRFNVGFVASNVQVSAMTHRVPAGKAVSAEV